MVFNLSSSNIGDIFYTCPVSLPPASPSSSSSSGKASCSLVRAIVKGNAAPPASSCLVPPSQLPWWRQVLKKQPKDSLSNCLPSEEDLESHLGLVKRFSLREVQLMTNNFAHVLGEGGFSMVYKGSLVDGSLVAVKRMEGSNLAEFLTQLKVSSKIKHRNVLSLLGFCIIPTELFLVYPFMPCGSVARHLRSSRSNLSDRGTTLEWSVRMRVATGVAKALAYLHEDCNPKIIHRDIKALNVLLDEKY
ncbi:BRASSINOSTEROID INSENSITIVE 1-associated receptor kinase 1-like [Syzygium oleosum]|uniref:BRASSINOSTEROID INSENSITIVE 1-associated receptor kinase 1-like n=1 Tax=Syzygium oleosum TaxID=219896 RepID=UPI0024B9BA48|nr:BRASSINOSTEROID INSENSITIVE 1-associated receptor kinase 1-like [Syzygium oleosum]